MVTQSIMLRVQIVGSASTMVRMIPEIQTRRNLQGCNVIWRKNGARQRSCAMGKRTAHPGAKGFEVINLRSGAVATARERLRYTEVSEKIRDSMHSKSLDEGWLRKR